MVTKLVRNSRSLLILGVLLAVIAFVLAFSVLSKAQGSPATQAAAQPTPVPAPALIAKTDVPAFTPITDLPSALQYFRAEPVHGYVAPDYVQGPTGLADLLVQGPRHLALKIPKGQPLLTTELISNTVAGAIDYSPLLNKGEVAETIAVQPVAAGAGNIQPSDHVDLLVTYKLPLQTTSVGPLQSASTAPRLPGIDRSSSPANTWETQTTLENLRVLSVAGVNYTLAVPRQDALVLKWVKDTAGTVDLVVRSADDSGRKPSYYQTTPILPDYLAHDGHMRNHFVEP
jgi:Flp pilus assembly protein CpaB